MYRQHMLRDEYALFSERSAFFFFSLKSLEVQCTDRKVHILVYSLIHYYKVSMCM